MSVNKGLVSGRQYTRTRPRGHVGWKPRGKALEVISKVQEIIADYHQASTRRQIFYRLVVKYGFEKTEKFYKSLDDYLNRARRAQCQIGVGCAGVGEGVGFCGMKN